MDRKYAELRNKYTIENRECSSRFSKQEYIIYKSCYVPILICQDMHNRFPTKDFSQYKNKFERKYKTSSLQLSLYGDDYDIVVINSDNTAIMYYFTLSVKLLDSSNSFESWRFEVIKNMSDDKIKV